MPGRAQSPDTDSTLVPAERVVPISRYQAPPWMAISAAAQNVSTLLTTVGCWPVAVRDRIGRAIARDAALALQGLDQRRLLAADVGAGAHVDRDVEVEAGLPRDGLAEQALGATPREHGA